MDEETQSKAGTFEALHKEINEALAARAVWETKVASAYRIRHGLVTPRLRPWANSSDLNWPLSDTFIDKLKPFYIQQIYGSEVVAKFISCEQNQPSTPGTESEVEKWFDYVLKQKSNFEEELSIGVDSMLEVSPSHVKAYWDNANGKLCFDAVEPLNIVVPAWTRGLQEADWIVHVMEFSKDAFKRDPRFKAFAASKSNLDKVVGNGGSDRVDRIREQYKNQREGITYSKKDRVIVWEVWRRDKAVGDRWIVETRSPLDDEVEIRPKFIGGLDGGKKAPFVRLQTEIKGKGHYESRGVPEKLGPFEASLTKMWQDKHNCMTLSNRPLFISTQPGTQVVGQVNLNWNPGDILGSGIQKLDMGAPPISYDEEINSTRRLAEDVMQLPDFGVQEENGGARTLGELKLRAGQSGQSNDLRARNFRRSLGELYNMAWCICAEYKPSLEYLDDDGVKTLDAQALSGKYVIHPSGSADGWDREGNLQRAVQTYQMFAGNPIVNQVQAVKNVFDAQSPAMTRVMVIDPDMRAASEASKQAEELATMIVTAYPMDVGPTDDDATHLQTIAQFVTSEASKGRPFSPEQAANILMHAEKHEQQMIQRKDPKLQQLAADPTIPQAIQILTLASRGQSNLPAQPGTGTHSTMGTSPGGPGALGTSEPDGGKSVQALASAVKAGLPVGLDQYNAALGLDSLPPVHPGQAVISKPPEPTPNPQARPVGAMS